MAQHTDGKVKGRGIYSGWRGISEA